MRPFFIVLEGGEGSGKSSVLAAIQEKFATVASFTREPGGTPYAEDIRQLALKNPNAKTAPALTTLCLMFAARFDNIANSIEPAFAQGKHLISDRFDASTFAYQVFAQSNSSLEDAFSFLHDKLPVQPDMYIYLDVDPKEAVRRLSGRKERNPEKKGYDHFDDREIQFHERVRTGYMTFFQKYNVPHVIVDTHRPLDEVKKDVVEKISNLFATCA